MNWGALWWLIPAAAGVTVVVYFVKGLHWLISRRKTLLATVSCHPFKIPPTVETFVEEQKEKVRIQIAKFFERHPKGKTYDEPYSHAQSLAGDVKCALLDDLPYYVGSAEGCWFARIENYGERKCLDINLKLPHAVFATIRHDKSGEPITLGKINEIIAIGELRPKGHCDVTAWTNIRVTNGHLPDVQITHESGSGRVRASWQTDRLGFVASNLAKNFLGAVLIFIGLFALFGFVEWAAVIIAGSSGPKPPLQSPQPANASITPPRTSPQSSTETPSKASAANPNQAPTVNQRDFDGAEKAFKQVVRLEPEQEAQYNLAQIAFGKKDYTRARDRFEALLNATPALGDDKSQASQIIKLKIYLTLLLEGNDNRALKMMEQFQFTGDTPALYYAQAAWEFKHNNPAKANDWIVSARKIYPAALNLVFADSLYDLGWLAP